MSYVICKHINIKLETDFSYVVFKTDSYEWSDWHLTLEQALQAMYISVKQHSSDSIRNDAIAFLSREKHLQLSVIPELLPYLELLDQYQEIFI